MKFLKCWINVLFVFILISSAEAQSIIDASTLKNVAVPIHIFELVLAFFICYMSLKFFRITKPIGLFLYIYTAIGFFIINILLNLMYLTLNDKLKINFVDIYVGGRVALIGMLISFVIFFYQWDKVMRRK